MPLISTDIQQQISELVEEKFSELNLPEDPQSLYGPVKYTLSLGGKRIRPYFTLVGCGLCGGDIDEAIPAAIAIELLHNFTLLHDDIMDSASTRRGKPSVFRKWDASTAILSGDAMYAWSFEQLQYYGRNEHFTKQQYSGILDIFLESAKTVCEGQANDLDFEKLRSVSLDKYMEMIQGKTAALIGGSFKLGGMVAGIDHNCIDRLEAIGKHVGIGFQIQDDLLDVLADPKKFGKERGGDILEGKKTYLSILSLQRSNPEEQAELHRIFKKNTVSEEEIEDVISLYRQQDVIEMARETIDKEYSRAIEHIDKFRNSPFKEDLIKFLTNLKNREY